MKKIININDNENNITISKLIIKQYKKKQFKNKRKIKSNSSKENKSLKKSFFIFIFLLLIIIIIFMKIFRKTKSQNIKKNIVISNNISYNLNDYYEKRMKELQRNSIIYPLPSVIKLKPMMSKKEIKAFSYFMKPENIYFEYGAGGSTNIASYYKLKKIYSVESDVGWHNKLKKYNLEGITYITVDLNAKNNGGYPGPGTNIEDWKNYFQAYKSEYNADIIFIDGRFRVACALDIFSKIKYDTLVLIHNYTNRVEYSIIEQYYFKMKSWDTLTAFFKYPNISFIPKEVYDKYMYIPKLN